MSGECVNKVCSQYVDVLKRSPKKPNKLKARSCIIELFIMERGTVLKWQRQKATAAFIKMKPYRWNNNAKTDQHNVQSDIRSLTCN